MTPRVALQITELRKCLLAARMPAFVGFVPGMRPDVLLEMRQLSELSLADLAAVGFDAKMNSRVLRQIGGVGEGLRALSAFVGLGFSHVGLRVQLKVRL